LNSHGAFPEVHDKTRATGTVPTVKSTSRWLSPPSNESFATRNRKFSILVVKCLIKLTKDLQSTIDEVDLDHILQIIHVYLQELGIDEIRRSKLIEWVSHPQTAPGRNTYPRA
ncbi:hypothetical protein Tco_0354707, partial [Tanacetum coccineum]